MLTLFNNSIDGEVYSIPHYVIKFVSALRQYICMKRGNSSYKNVLVLSPLQAYQTAKIAFSIYNYILHH